MHFHLVALTYFKETVRRGSIRQAAEALNVAASAVNRQILKLEEQLECELFERTSDGMRLTGAGEVFYHHVLRQHQDLERTISEIEDLRGIRRGHVAVTCEEGFAKDCLPPVLASFHKEFPRVTFDIEVAGMSGVIAAVAQGEADIGIAFDPAFDPNLRRVAAVHVPIGAAIPPGHPLASSETLRLGDLVGEATVLVDETYDIHRRLNARMKNGGPALSKIIETNSFEAMTALVKSGIGIGLRTRVGIMGEIARGEIAFVPLVDREFHSEEIVICARAKRTLPVAAALLCERMVAALSELADPA